MNIQTTMKKMETAIVMVTTIAQHQEAAVPTALVIHKVLMVHRIPTLEVQEVQVDFPAEVMEEHLAKRLKSAEAF